MAQTVKGGTEALGPLAQESDKNSIITQLLWWKKGHSLENEPHAGVRSGFP